MLLVQTNNQNDKKFLSQHFLQEGNSWFRFPSNQSQTLIEIVRSIGFQSFQKDLPVLAQKIQEIIINSIHKKYSLILIREVMSIIRQEQSTLRAYQSHFIQMNKAFLGEDEQLIIQSRRQANLVSNHLFQNSLKGQIHQMINIESLDFQLYSVQNQDQRITKNKEKATSTTISSDIEEIIKDKSLQSTTNNILFTLFHSEAFSSDQWKNQSQMVHQNSKELIQLKRKGVNLFQLNKELNPLIQDQIQYDMTQDLYLSTKSTKRSKQIENFMYKKMMKQAVMHSKIRLRKKRD